MLPTDEGHIPLKHNYLLPPYFGDIHPTAVPSKGMAAMKSHSLYVI